MDVLIVKFNLSMNVKAPLLCAIWFVVIQLLILMKNVMILILNLMMVAQLPANLKPDGNVKMYRVIVLLYVKMD